MPLKEMNISILKREKTKLFQPYLISLNPKLFLAQKKIFLFVVFLAGLILTKTI